MAPTDGLVVWRGRAVSGTRVAQLVVVFGVSEASVYSWLKQDRIDRGERLAGEAGAGCVIGAWLAQDG